MTFVEALVCLQNPKVYRSDGPAPYHGLSIRLADCFVITLSPYLEKYILKQ